MNKHAMMTLYYSFIYPYIAYCNNVWGSSYASNTEKVYNLQKRALRIMFNIGKRESVIPMFSEMCILKFPDINVYLTSRFMFRYHHGFVPGIFHGYFTPNMDVHKYHTRQSTYFHIPVVKSDLSKCSIRYRGAVIWNEILKLVIDTCTSEMVLWNRLNRVYMTLRSASHRIIYIAMNDPYLRRMQNNCSYSFLYLYWWQWYISITTVKSVNML